METNNMKAMRNKTIADIVAEKRARANKIESATGGMPNQFQRELIADLRADADELEAAAKRELADFKPKCDWSVREALNFANTLANHGWTQEANSDAASSCIFSLCRLLKECGNTAAIREALEEATERLIRIIGCDHYTFHRNEYHCDSKTTMGECRNKNICETIFKAQAALAKPPRQCDVGTADEQQNRFREFCRKYDAVGECGLGRSEAKCPAFQGGHNPDCSLWWAQMPYEVEKEGGAK